MAVPSLPAVSPLSVASALPSWGPLASALFTLTKPQLAFMSVLTTMSAYATARPPANPVLTLATLAGTALAAGGALSLNQWWEREADALMQRTCGRPLPQSLLPARVALAWSVALGIGGVSVLAAVVNVTAAAVAVATILIYGLVYTPLKRRTRWATEVGAISGALPALLGNAAAGNVGAIPGLVLTGLLLFWQMPHFFAIGWRHRGDYRAAGFPLLPAIDDNGARTGAWSFGYAAVLFVGSLAPWVLGWLGPVYGVSAVLMGAGFLWCAWQFAADETGRDRAAKRLFLASIVYLPVVMSALVIDQIGRG